MNQQEAFDAVCRHLFTQRRQSISAGGDTCEYRGPRGARCAIGALIPDDQYSRAFEARAAHAIVASVPALFGLHGDFLDGLQAIHDDDDWEDPATLRDSLESFAYRNGLEASVLTDELVGEAW